MNFLLNNSLSYFGTNQNSHHYMPCFQLIKFGKNMKCKIHFGLFQNTPPSTGDSSCKLNALFLHESFCLIKSWKLRKIFHPLSTSSFDSSEGRKIWPRTKECLAALTKMRRFSQSPILNAARLLHVWCRHDFCLKENCKHNPGLI